MAELMPMSCPLRFTRAPPELPGFSAASVWIYESRPRRRAPLPLLMLRALALTMPAVTVELNPNGLPTASTHSPILTASESPNVIGLSPEASILIRARSVFSSVPIILASYVVLSFSSTSSLSASSMTWLLVTIYPSLLMITPDPRPLWVGSPSLLSRGCWRRCCGWPKKNSNGSMPPNGLL